MKTESVITEQSEAAITDLGSRNRMDTNTYTWVAGSISTLKTCKHDRP